MAITFKIKMSLNLPITPLAVAFTRICIQWQLHCLQILIILSTAITLHNPHTIGHLFIHRRMVIMDLFLHRHPYRTATALIV